jgi:hypothetical protein
MDLLNSYIDRLRKIEINLRVFVRFPVWVLESEDRSLISVWAAGCMTL